MRNLPAEIYLKIFDLLNRRDLSNCTTVCQEWNRVAAEVYYQDLVISKHNLKALKSYLQDGSRHLKNCSFVEKLSLDEIATSKLSKTEFMTFITYLPNLKTIKIYNSDECVKYLLEVDTDKYLTRVEKIKIMQAESNIAIESIYYHFRASLKYIDISHTNDSVLLSKYNGILDYISKFKKLTHLRYSSTSTTDHQLSLYQLQVSRPTLTDIILGTGSRIPILKPEDNRFYDYGNLTNLTFVFPLLHSSYVDLITRHLPISVKKVIISMTETSLYNWINIIGIKKALKLFESLSNLPFAMVNFRTLSENEEDLEDTTKESAMTTFFKVLDTFKGNKKVFCSVKFSDFDSSFSIFKFNNGVLDAHYALKRSDIYGNNQESTIRFALPNKSVSISGLEIINKVQFSISSEDDNFTYELLKHCLTNFPHLQYAEFFGITRPCQFFQLSGDDEWRSFDSMKVIGDPNNPTTTQENIKKVKLGGFIPSSNFLNLMSTYLPNLKILTCWARYYTGSLKNNTTFMDLTQFKNLQTVYFDIDLLSNRLESFTCFIRFEYTDGETINYQYISKRNKASVKVTPLDLQDQDTSIGTIVFICDRIDRFTIFKETTRIDFFQGVPQNNSVGIEEPGFIMQI